MYLYDVRIFRERERPYCFHEFIILMSQNIQPMAEHRLMDYSINNGMIIFLLFVLCLNCQLVSFFLITVGISSLFSLTKFICSFSTSLVCKMITYKENPLKKWHQSSGHHILYTLCPTMNCITKLYSSLVDISLRLAGASLYVVTVEAYQHNHKSISKRLVKSFCKDKFSYC